jgi:hypothetical protein
MSGDNTQTFDDIINNFENLYKKLLVKEYIEDTEQDLMVMVMELMKKQHVYIAHLEQERKIENDNLELRIQQALNISNEERPKF